MARIAFFLFAVMPFAGIGQTVSQNRDKPLTYGALRNYLFTRLKEMRVQNPDGEELGKLQDVIIDLKTGKPRFAVISSGGLLGFRKREKIAPVSALSSETAKTGTLA